ncbi:MAG: class I SAM-dependent methyltransferase [Armatimonadota bacterium]
MYDTTFFESQQHGARKSASKIVPFLMQVVRPNSVIDFGCGSGTWLKVFQDAGVEDIKGLDGSADGLELGYITEAQFEQHDLSKPVRLNRKYDLAISLEVAEHIPEPFADVLVQSLCEASDCILFSAAIPWQGGHAHANEQWPAYWAARFRQRGYIVCDPVRPLFWQDPDVCWWYAQNCLLYVKECRKGDYHELGNVGLGFVSEPLPLVHPKLYERVNIQLAFASDPEKVSFATARSLLFQVIRTGLRRRLRR